jgi:hypothetical protein
MLLHKGKLDHDSHILVDQIRGWVRITQHPFCRN